MQVNAYTALALRWSAIAVRKRSDVAALVVVGASVRGSASADSSRRGNTGSSGWKERCYCLLRTRHYFHVLQLESVLWIHRLRAASGRFKRNSISNSKFLEKRVRAGQVMRDDTRGAIHFVNGFTRPRSHLLLRIIDKVDGTNKRLGEIHGVVGNRRDRQNVAVSHQVNASCRDVASRNAV